MLNTSDFLLEVINNQQLNKPNYLTYSTPKEAPLPFWLQLIVNIGFGVIAAAIEIAASAFLGPVAGMLVGTGADIASSFIADAINGNDPWSLENVLFNTIIPIVGIPGKIKGISRIGKSKMLGIGELTDSDDLIKLAGKLNRMDLRNPDVILKNQRNYQLMMNSIDDLNLNKSLVNESTIFNKTTLLKSKRQKIQDLSKRLRYTSKAINAVINPNYAITELLNFATKPLKRKLNKKITSYVKTIKSKFFKSIKHSTTKTLIPLNHTVAPWIRGVRVIPANNCIGWYHIMIIFDSKLTKGKKPVIVYNKSALELNAFLNAPSAGQYYINYICWGWNIGKLIRDNSFIGLMKFSSINFGSHYKQLAYNTANLFKSIVKLVDAIENSDDLIKRYKDAFTPKNLLTSVAQSATTGIKYTSLPKAAIRSLQEKNNKYIIKNISFKIKKNVNKKLKSYVKNTSIAIATTRRK